MNEGQREAVVHCLARQTEQAGNRSEQARNHFQCGRTLSYLESGQNVKIAVVSHALVGRFARSRWERLAAEHGHEVHLLVPETWTQAWFGDETRYVVDPEDHDKFHLCPLPTNNTTSWGRYYFRSIDANLRRIEPDLIYVVQDATALVQMQLVLYRRLHAPDAKLVFFSMNQLGIYPKRPRPFLAWHLLRRAADAAFVHYPGCVPSLRRAGFRKPIFLQTQIGVHDRAFFPDRGRGDAKRQELGLENRYVIGFCGRLTADKGLDDLLVALPPAREDWALLLVGDGPMYDEVKEFAAERGWDDRIVVTGAVPHDAVPDYMRVMDLFVLGSKTRPHWIDTFPLVTVQAMCTGVPVIGSSSGAIPWQLSDEAGLLFPEGDRAALKRHIDCLATNPDRATELAQRGRQRVLDRFSVTAINKEFATIANAVTTHRLSDYHGPESVLNDTVEPGD